MLFTCETGMSTGDEEKRFGESREEVHERTVTLLDELALEIVDGDVVVDAVTEGRNPDVQGKIATPYNLSKRRLVVDYREADY